MSGLAASDVGKLLAFVHEAARVDGVDPFPEPLREALWQLVPCDHVDLDLVGPDIFDTAWSVGWSLDVFTEEMAEVCAQHFEDYPLRPSPALWNKAVRRSDFIPQQDWRQTECWSAVGRPLGIEDSLRLWIADDEGLLGGLDFATGRSGFRDRDVAVLTVLSPHLAQFMRAAAARSPARDRDHGLTVREHEILTLVARGRTTAEIAQQLWISPHTARKHLENVLGKLEVTTRAAAVARVFGGAA